MNWDNYDLLTMVEEVAESNNWISSEEQLSEMFDTMVKELNINYGDDEDMMNEDFNNWTDGLCKDGTIHEEQYRNYGYVGKWS